MYNNDSQAECAFLFSFVAREKKLWRNELRHCAASPTDSAQLLETEFYGLLNE